jgi:excisionase family DNA binding protein
METEFLTLKEASKFLRISVATLNRFMREEKIPSYKVGGRRLFDKTELIEWVKEHRSSFSDEAEANKEGR